MAWFSKRKYTSLRQPTQRHRIPEGMWMKCPNCMEIVSNKDWEANLKACPNCGHHQRLTARERIWQLADPGSFEEFDPNMVSDDPLCFVDNKPYPQRLSAARKQTGERDAVVTGVAKIHDRPVSLAVMDFNFNGGSMGSVVGEKVARAMERAIEWRLPVLAVCASGGARMQEGMFSLMQMAKTSALAGRLGRMHLPYFVLLTHPTYAGVMASFASLGDVIVAEPDSLVGFAGPRVIEQTIKQILPPGFQKSEFVKEHGFIDIVAPRHELRDLFGRLIHLLAPEPAIEREPREQPERPTARVIESVAH